MPRNWHTPLNSDFDYKNVIIGAANHQVKVVKMKKEIRLELPIF